MFMIIFRLEKTRAIAREQEQRSVDLEQQKKQK
jgi:hypothetical protein